MIPARLPFLMATLATAVFAGCVGNDAEGGSDAAAMTEAAQHADHLVSTNLTTHSCYGYNAFVFADTSAVDGLVPTNWTLSGPAPNGALALIRILALGCSEEWRVILSTPMVPDDASLVHHDNPDHVLSLYSNNESYVNAWNAWGIDAALADITWQVSPPTHDQIIVTTNDGVAMDLIMLDPREPVGGSYEWLATYSFGTETIGWFHGQENAPTRRAEPGPLTFGPASPFPGISTTPWAGQAWLGFDVTYTPGPGTH